MLKKLHTLISVALAGLLLGACSSTPSTDSKPATPASAPASKMPFGDIPDTNYAHRLWEAMTEAQLVGPSAKPSETYIGQHPHGAFLQTLEEVVLVGGNTGPVIVKRNFGGPGVSQGRVDGNPRQYLEAVTVMFKRPGYDPQNNDWLWVKYRPDGSIDKTPEGIFLAGRVAGCIACHSNAPGGDLVFTSDRYAN